MSVQPLHATQIPCCLCGTMILPNAANQCPTCLAQEFNIQERIQRGPGGAEHITIYQCRQCRRYKRNEKLYEYAEPESPELLSLCLKQIPALQHQTTGGSTNTTIDNAPLHIVDANWIWTEPHSMRFKIRLTVRTEIQNVAVQQRVMVLLHCSFQMCKECNREYTNRTWHALVQLRQKRDSNAPKKGLITLEMALSKNKDIRKHVLRIDNAKNGFDFYFLNLRQAQIFVSFIQKIIPTRIKHSTKLVSSDVKNNTANMKHTITCDLVPLCKDDLILIHKSAKTKLAGRLAIVSKVATGVIHLIDASPKRDNLFDSQMELSADTYYKSEKYYTVLQSSHRMTRFVILDVELCNNSNNNNHNNDNTLYEGPKSGIEKYALADVEIARESDFGINNETYTTVTHLGHLINSGDIVMGYDLEATTLTNFDLDESLSHGYIIPDICLVKKVTGDSNNINNNNDKNNNNNNQDDDNEIDEGKRRISKKKERKQKKLNKRRRELEESAERMGFLEDDREYRSEKQQLLIDDDLAAEISALERDFEELGKTASEEEIEEHNAIQQDNNTPNQEDNVDVEDDNQ